MNYYKRHIGDWMKDTMHLTAEQEGIYDRLVQQYYSREGPLPRSIQTCEKIARCNTKGERAAVRFCLKEFFTVTAQGYRHKRCDREIAAYQAKAAKNREIGKLGGRPPNSVRDVSRGTEPSGLSGETQTVSTKEPFGNPSHKPLATNKEKEKRTLASEQLQDKALRVGPRGQLKAEPEPASAYLPTLIRSNA